MERLKTAERVAGLKQSAKKVSQGMAQQAYAAEDADPHITESFAELCRENGVPLELVPTMKELAKACGIDVPCAVAVVLKQPQ